MIGGTWTKDGKIFLCLFLDSMEIWNQVYVLSIGFEIFLNPNLVNDLYISWPKEYELVLLRHGLPLSVSFF